MVVGLGLTLPFLCLFPQINQSTTIMTHECHICLTELEGVKHYFYEADDDDMEDFYACLSCSKENKFGCPDEVINPDGTRRNGVYGIDDVSDEEEEEDEDKDEEEDDNTTTTHVRITATYNVSSDFVLPTWIRGDDIQDYRIRYDVLHLTLKDGRKYEIQPYQSAEEDTLEKADYEEKDDECDWYDTEELEDDALEGLMHDKEE